MPGLIVVHRVFFQLVLVFLSVIILRSDCTGQFLPDEKLIDFNLPNVGLDSALTALSQNTDIHIAYSKQDIPNDLRVTIVANNLNLGVVLDDILSNTNLIYEIIGSQLVVYKDPQLLAKKKYRINGYVLDKSSGESLVYASIYNDKKTIFESSNEYGYYTIDLPYGENVLNFSYLGYDLVSKYLFIESDTNLIIHLNANILLNEVVVSANVGEPIHSKSISDHISIEENNNLPTLLGESDIKRMAQLIPGVNTATDGLGGFVVRGGYIDQNMVSYDGIPVYNMSHALGIFSIFNTSLVKSAHLMKGGFPARFGGFISSLLSVRTKEGDMKKIGGDISISPLVARATIEGPIIKNKGSFIVSGRRSIIDPILQPVSEFQFGLNNQSGSVNYYFQDYSAKINFQLGDSDHIFFSSHWSHDKYSYNKSVTSTLNGIELLANESTLWNWNNNLATVRWTHEFSNKVFSHFSLGITKFDFEYFEFDKSTLNDSFGTEASGYQAKLYDSEVEDRIVKMDFEYSMSQQLKFNFGANYVFHSFIPGSVFSDSDNKLILEKDFLEPDDLKSISTFPQIQVEELRIYLENEIDFGKHIDGNIGIHFSKIFTIDNKTYTSIQPRIFLKFAINGGSDLSLSYSNMNQNIHLLSNTGIGLPNDVWVPSTSKVKPQASHQYSIEWKNRIKNIETTIGAFYKKMENLHTYLDGAVFNVQSNFNWENELISGSGRAYGMELSLKKQSKNVSTSLSYTWSRSLNKFAELNNNAEFFTNHHREHNINLSSVIQLSRKVNLSLLWTYGSGTPYTAPTNKYQVIVDNKIQTVVIFGDRNNAFLPAYHRLDFSINFFKNYGWGQQTISIGAYNIYNRKNPFYIDFVVGDPDNNNLHAESVSIFPILPNFSYRLSF